MSPTLIALVGRAGAGKDTVGKIIENTPGLWFSLSFATPLKQFVRDVFDFSDEQLYGPSEMRNAPDPRYPRPDGTELSPREALQQLGTEWGRKCYPDIWAELGVRRALAHLKRGHGVVITDCRFTNEARAVRGAGGHVWRIRRTASDRVLSTHPSETEMDSPEMRRLTSLFIDNDGTLETLQATIKSLLRLAVGVD